MWYILDSVDIESCIMFFKHPVVVSIIIVIDIFNELSVYYLFIRRPMFFFFFYNLSILMISDISYFNSCRS